MMDHDTITKIVAFQDLCEQLTHPFGVDVTHEVLGELLARWSELRRLGVEVDAAVERYLQRTGCID